MDNGLQYIPNLYTKVLRDENPHEMLFPSE